MQIRIKDKVICQYSVRRMIYAFCFALFCIIDQRVKTGTGLDGWIETFLNLTGVAMAVIILSHYKKEDFLKWKIPHITWSVICVIGFIRVICFYRDSIIFMNHWLSIAANVILYGYVLIQTFVSVVIEKKYPRINKRFAILWLVMMLWMILSRSKYIWPVCYLGMFGCFYLTDYSKEAKKDLFQGMLDGIILGFFILQGLCFVFRPYDCVRYQGIYHNPNMNALFYLEVLAAVLVKLLYVIKEKASKGIRIYYWLGAGVVLAFELLTIGRAGWLTSIVMVGVFLWCLCKVQATKKWFKNLVILSLCVVLTFPICFSAVRYLPPVFHHPIWFWGEWSEQRVHSWDEWDSEKYIELDEYFEAALGRIYESFDSLFENSPFAITAKAAETEPLPANKIPVLTKEEYLDSYKLRSTIYKYYAGQLNITGHPYEEQGFQAAPNYWVGHAHNIFLQFGTDFGVPMMIMFMVLIVWSLITMGKRFCASKEMEYAAGILFLLAIILFGIFECSWTIGGLSMITMFIVWRDMICE